MIAFANDNGAVEPAEAPLSLGKLIPTNLITVAQRLMQLQAELAAVTESLIGKVTHTSMLPPKARMATASEKLMTMLEQDPNRLHWSLRRWADAIGCSHSTLQRTSAWRRILVARAMEQARRRSEPDD